ncbi:MAG: hypothetical protein K0V04_00630, partial [Deltaproteobacteria bacterium]|nr:hypothetical protein [Deltaproteobacteria bacterium]
SRRGALPLALLAAGAVALVPGRADAVCGTFVADDGDNTIYYGIAARPLRLDCPFGPIDGWAVIQDGAPRAAVCWQDRDGQWRYEEFGTCNAGTDSWESLMILAGEGDDRVIPVTHQQLNHEFVCPVPGTSGNFETYFTPAGVIPASPTMLEWQDRYTPNSQRSASSCANQAGCATLPMGVAVFGGPGSDEIHGTPHDDFIYTAEFDSPMDCEDHMGGGSTLPSLNSCVCPLDSYCCDNAWDDICVDVATTFCGLDCTGPFEYLAADGEIDTACGHDGSDFMIGDRDDAAGAHERFAGGPGPSDYCAGTNDSAPMPCCEATATPGCPADPGIESDICAVDPFCCNNAWDSLCVGEVTTVAGESCDNPTEFDTATSSCETPADVITADLVWTGGCLPPGGSGSCFGPAPAVTICDDADPESLPPADYPTVSSNVFSDNLAFWDEQCVALGGFPGVPGVPGIPGFPSEPFEPFEPLEPFPQVPGLPGQ